MPDGARQLGLNPVFIPRLKMPFVDSSAHVAGQALRVALKVEPGHQRKVPEHPVSTQVPQKRALFSFALGRVSAVHPRKGLKSIRDSPLLRKKCCGENVRGDGLPNSRLLEYRGKRAVRPPGGRVDTAVNACVRRIQVKKGRRAASADMLIPSP